MRKLIQDLLLISFVIGFIYASSYDISKGRYNPEISAFGNAGIAGFSIPNGVQLNPANIAQYNGWNNYWYGARFENDLIHNDFSMSFKVFDFAFGLSYINQNLGNIPNTDIFSGRIRDYGSVAEYITQTQFHAATKLTNLPLFKEFDLGATIGLQSYSFMSDQDVFIRYGSVFSLDFFPDLYFGLLLNDKSEINPFNYGLQYRQPEYKIIIDKGDKGLAMGGEYALNKSLSLRGGVDRDFINMGLGLFYDKLYFFGKEDMGIRFDYTLQLPIEKYPFEPQHLFGITVREQDKLPIPFLYKYPPFTNKKSANVVGWSLAGTSVQIYYRDILINMVQANQNGYWEATLPLNLEINDFHFKAIQKGPRKESLPSKKYRIVVDQLPPDFKFEAFVRGNMVTLDVYPSETLINAPYVYELKRSTFFNKNKYSIEAEIQDIFEEFKLNLQDNAGNEVNLLIEEPFINFASPQQPLVITYKDRYQFIGEAGIYHDLSVVNYRNKFKEDIPLIGKRLTIFKPIVPLEFGLNQILFIDVLPKGKVNYSFSVYRKFQYKDINDDDANLLATCYILPNDTLFEPLRRVRQHELIKWIMSLWNIESVFITNELSVDDAYNLALKSRLITNRDDMRYISRGEAMDIISRAFGYTLFDVYRNTKYFENISQDHPYIKAINYFVEKGYLDIEGRFYDPEVFITRQEIMEWLKKSPYFMKLKRELGE